MTDCCSPAPSVAADRIVVPSLVAVIRHSWLNVVLGKLVPAGLFVALFTSAGATLAIVGALAWSLGVVGYQRQTGQRVAGLVILAIVGNVAKSAVALATGSLLLYFVQPTISTVLIGLAFAISVPLRQPLAERLVHDFLPLDEATANHPELKRFFPRLSLLWAASSLFNGGLTLTLLLTQSITTFVILKAMMGPVLTSLTLAAAATLLRRNLRRAGVEVRFASRLGATPAEDARTVAATPIGAAATPAVGGVLPLAA
ncbi:MAG: VC0807 family protein [Acidimicrobiales bacterium]